MRDPKWGRLAVRLWMVGLLQLSLVVLGAFLMGPVMGRILWRADMGALSETILPVLGDPDALEHELARLLTVDHAEVSVYGKDGELRASNVQPPLPPLRQRHDRMPPVFPPMSLPHPVGTDSPPGLSPTFREGLPGLPPLPPPLLLSRLEVPDGEMFVVARLPRHTPLAWPFAPTVAFGVVVVSVGFLLIRRLVTRPLRELSAAVNAFGSGDLTVRTKLVRTDEFGALSKAFDDMADRVQELRTAEKELLANVAHELRTPLARVRVALDIAKETDVAQATEGTALQSILSEIGTDLNELEGLIDDVLTSARLEISAPNRARAGFPLHRQVVAAENMVRLATDRFRQCRPDRALELRLEENLPSFEGDPALFRRVLANLLDNADKYSPDPKTAVTFTVGSREGCVFFEVEDRGQGIKPDELERVFWPFYRAERSRTRTAGGVGLGLLLAKRIVEAHGGTISLTSEVGIGTRVLVQIPASEGA